MRACYKRSRLGVLGVSTNFDSSTSQILVRSGLTITYCGTEWFFSFFWMPSHYFMSPSRVFLILFKIQALEFCTVAIKAKLCIDCLLKQKVACTRCAHCHDGVNCQMYLFVLVANRIKSEVSVVSNDLLVFLKIDRSVLFQ